MNTDKKEAEAAPVTVLVVDDDPDTRSIVSGAVEMLGFRAEEAENGTIAVEFCQREMPDLAVLDVMMPGMDGNQVCRAIRALDGGELVAIVMLTARDTVDAKVASLEGGADDYLTKPFHYRELQARLQALWRVRQLNVRLHQKNLELARMQEKLLEQERKLAIGQLAGTAAHELGQPLAAILLNCHLLETLPPDDSRYRASLAAIGQDARRMAALLEQLRNVDGERKQAYFKGTQILDLKGDEPA